MTGTTAFLSSDAGGSLLPAPVMRLARSDGGSFSVADGSPNSNQTVKVSSVNVLTASVHGLPKIILDNLDQYAPKLELLRYVRRRTGHNSFSRNFKNSGYVHPANGPAPSGNGSYTHGGGIGNFVNISAIRPTEWDVTQWGQVIDVTQGLYGFMQLMPVSYRDAALNDLLVTALAPSGSNINTSHGKRFPYAGVYRPAYYRFRWSVLDVTDDRAQRITGALSDTVSLTNSVFPFIPDVTNGAMSTAKLDTRFNGKLGQMWIGSVSRLPR